MIFSLNALLCVWTRVLGRGSGPPKSGLMDRGVFQRVCRATIHESGLSHPSYQRNRHPRCGVCLKQLCMTGVQGKWVRGSLCTSLLLEKTSTEYRTWGNNDKLEKEWFRPDSKEEISLEYRLVMRNLYLQLSHLVFTVYKKRR